MPEADGQIRIKVNLDTQEIDKDMQKLQEKLEKQNESLNRQSIVVEKLTSRYEILYKKAQETALPTVESQKILQEIWKIEKEYKNLKNLYDTTKLSPKSRIFCHYFNLLKVLLKTSNLTVRLPFS